MEEYMEPQVPSDNQPIINNDQPVIKQHTISKPLLILVIVFAVVAVGSLIGLFIALSRPPETITKVVKGTDSSSQAPTMFKGVIDTSFGYPLTYVYPAGWSASHTVTGPMPVNVKSGATVETATLTSPSGNVSVKVSVGTSPGQGSGCDEKTAGQFVNVAQQDVPGLPVVSLVEYTMRNYTASYPNGPYAAGLVETNAARLFATDGSLCSAYRTNVVKLTEAGNVYLLDGSIYVKDIHTLDDYATAQKTDEYKQAIAILLSVKH